jgi:sugar-specific transcriptional regulator TrmB
MDEAIDQLTELGLSNYEARAFWVLVDSGPTIAEEVAKEADIPMGRIYDVLNSLNDQSLVRHDDGRPRTYVPVAGDRAVSQLLDQRVEELQQRKDRYESTAEELQTYLDTVETTDGEQSFATSAFREDDTISLVSERLETASETVQIAAGSVRVPPEARGTVTDQLLGLLEHDVRIRLLATADAEFTGEIEQLREAGLELRLSPKTPEQRFFVVDESEVLLEVFHPVSSDELLAGVNFRDEAIAADLAASFEELWETGEPL